MKTQFMFFLVLVVSFLSSFAMSNEKCRTSFDVPDHVKKTFAQPEVLAQYMDHTLLKQDATLKQIRQLAEEAIAYKMKAVCVNSCRVHDVKVYLDKRADQGHRVPIIAATIGFPLGASSTKAKIEEARQAYDDGARELDVVMNIGAIKDGRLNLVKKEVKFIKLLNNDVIVKAIIETDLLTKPMEVIDVAKAVVEGGADFVKTSSGFVPNGKGATLQSVQLMKRGIRQANNVSPNKKVEIKASGGIKTYDQALKFLKIGVTRLGTSSALPILQTAMDQQDITPPKVRNAR